MSPLTPEQTELKDKGNALIGSGDFIGAIEAFTSALKLSGGTPEGLAILHSNRCAARLKSGDLPAALQDAEKAIEYNGMWNKAYARKAEVLNEMKQYKEAAACYQKAALISDPNSNDTTKFFHLKQECLKFVDKPAKSNSRNPFPTPSATVTSLDAFVWQKDGLIFALRLFSLIMSILYVIGIDDRLFAFVLLTQGLVLISTILKIAGRPQFNAAWAEVALSRSEAVPALVCLAFSSFEPNLITLMCIHCLTIFPFLRQCRALMERIDARRLANRADLFLSRMYPLASDSNAKWASLDNSLQKHAVKLEFSVGLILLLHLLTPNRSFIALLLFSQTIKLRYITNEHTREGFSQVDKILFPLAQRFGIAAFYGKLKQLAISYVTPTQMPPVGGGSGGGMGGCLIM